MIIICLLQTQTYLSMNYLNTGCLIALQFLFLSLLSAQNIQLLDFSPELYRDGNLFKGVVLNPAEATSEFIEVKLYHNGQVIAVQKGRISLGSQNLSDATILSSFTQSPYGSLLELGFLPEGKYNLCISSGSEKADCKSYMHIVRPSPACVNLIYPSDKSELESNYPTLVWSSTLLNIEGLSFKPRVTKSQGTNRKEVSHFSMPDHYSKLTAENILQYPFTANELKDGEQYQWNVDLMLHNQLVCRSEVWKFHLTEDTIKTELPINLSYIDLNQVDDMAEFFILGELKLYLPIYSGKEEIRLKIKNKKGDNVQLKTSKVEFSKNEQYRVFDLSTQAKLNHLEQYLVEIKTPSTLKKIMITYVNPDFYSIGSSKN